MAHPAITQRRLARLAAVQGLYQAALSSESFEAIVKRLQDDPSAFIAEDQENAAIDTKLMMAVMTGVKEHNETIDELIAGALDSAFSLPRLEELLKAILRAGTFELIHCPNTQTGVIVNDYVDVTHSFFSAKEPALVNAVLDRLAKKLRA